MQVFFEHILAKLKKRIIKMLTIVSGQLEKSFTVLLATDSEVIALIKQKEKKVDKLDIKVDKLCQQIFALGQPVASDLRFIMSSLKISNEIERIGDIAYDIAKRSDTLIQANEMLNHLELKEFMQQILQLHNQLIECYTNLNVELATEIVEKSKNTKKNCKTIYNQVITEISDKPEHIFMATDLILIVRDFERILGHIENIAESVYFIGKAEIIKHAGLKKKKETISVFDEIDAEE